MCVGLRKLNFHKFKHYFNDSHFQPINDSVEDREHHFLLCHNYNLDRCGLLNSVNAILMPHGLMNLSNEDFLKIILYGHEE